MKFADFSAFLTSAVAELAPADRAAAVAALAGAQVQLVAAMSTPTAHLRQSPLATAEELAAEFNLPVTWFRSQARAGRLPAVKAGKYWRYDRDDIRAALGAEHRMGENVPAEKSNNGAGSFPSVSKSEAA